MDIAKLRALQRQAGRVVVEPVATAKANLPQPLFFKEGRQAGALGDEACEEDPAAGAALRRASDQTASHHNEASPYPLDASAPLFEKEGLGEICSSSRDAHPDNPIAPPKNEVGASIFGKEGLTEIRSPRPDIEALRRLIASRERKPSSSTPTPSASPQFSPANSRHPIDRSLPGEEIAPGLYLLQAHLPLAAPPEALPLAFAKRPDDSVDPRRLLFFDTETTGLAGGTGTRAFMIGAADWHHDPQQGDGLRIRQLMISTLSAEPAMLRAFAQWIAPDTVLSSYNGRCYDAPLLNTRYRLARIANPLSGLDHVDLLFPTRRMYRGVWENCRLATIERELLRIVREDDLPGSQAPAAWLHYLRGGSSSLLRRVVAHNHQDVVTLAQLMLRLIQTQRELDASL